MRAFGIGIGIGITIDIASLLVLLGIWCPVVSAASADDRGYFGYVATYEEKSPGEGQIRVIEIYDNGPADLAGLQAGDRINKVDGETFHFKNDLEMIRQFTSLQPGESVALDLKREDKPLRVVLTVGKQPEKRKQQLNQWMASAEEWFEQGGLENCRIDRNRLGIYRDLERRVLGEGVLVTMARSEDPVTDEVNYSTENGDFLPLALLQNTFLDALAAELPVGQSWTLLIRKQDSDSKRLGLVVIPQSGPRAGWKGIIVGPTIEEVAGLAE